MKGITPIMYRIDGEQRDIVIARRIFNSKVYWAVLLGDGQILNKTCKWQYIPHPNTPIDDEHVKATYHDTIEDAYATYLKYADIENRRIQYALYVCCERGGCGAKTSIEITDPSIDYTKINVVCKCMKKQRYLKTYKGEKVRPKEAV